jgi:hypothetical protein
VTCRPRLPGWTPTRRAAAGRGILARLTTRQPVGLGQVGFGESVRGTRLTYCGGHSFTPEGDVVFVGGTDMYQQVYGHPGEIWGHNRVYVFVNDPAGAYWVRLGAMSRERWYPTATTMNDGWILVTGHSQEPSTYSPPTESTFERFRVIYTGSIPTGIEWQPLAQGEVAEHVNIDIQNDDCGDLTHQIYIGEYPRNHALASGTVYWTGVHLLNSAPLSAFFDLLVCPTQDIKQRWTLGFSGTVAPKNAERGSVYYLDLAGGIANEYVFGLGGGQSYLGEISDKVVRMVNPSLLSEWVDDESVAPELNVNAYDGNYPILLDGSILRVGGYGYDGVQGEFPARKTAELFKPTEIFASPPAGWKNMKAQEHERRYHSVAVALPNGKVLSAGGNNTEDPDPSPEPSWWSVEVFSPPYMFQLPRPRITAFPATLSLGGDPTFDLSAILRTTSVGGEFRVALLAPGAATHAFDQHQKYVKLKVNQNEPPEPDPDPDVTTPMSLMTPPTGSVAPGWYMLVVTNSAGIPSNAKWVKVTP